MTLLNRVKRKLAHLCQRYVSDGMLAEWLAPTFCPWLFPTGRQTIPRPADVRTLLLWNLDSFGDFLFTTPLIRALRQGYPAARIELVINQACLPLAATNPHLDELIPIDPRPYYTGTGLLRLPNALRNRHYDVAVIAEMGVRPAEAGRVVARRLNAGYVVSSNAGLLKSLPNFTLPPNQGEYWPAYFLRLATHLGLTPVPAQLEVFPTPEDRQSAEKLLGPRGQDPRIAFHPMVASYALTTKKWPDESFVELGKLLSSQRPVQIFLTGSADEATACESLASRMRSTGVQATSVAGQLSLRSTVALYQQLELVVTGDTAALHLAAAAGVPTVALFGATDERLLSSPGMTVLKRDLPCRPCHKLTDRQPGWPRCHYDRPWCLHRISPDHVANIIKTMVCETAPEENPNLPLRGAF